MPDFVNIVTGGNFNVLDWSYQRWSYQRWKNFHFTISPAKKSFAVLGTSGSLLENQPENQHELDFRDAVLSV